ncbi:MAG: hypothetical protein M1826_002655 [Phylliscum demangeonii]|nr:MAG: hypothetical protein M1826_002655 [Phylliscum demangeonii]
MLDPVIILAAFLLAAGAGALPQPPPPPPGPYPLPNLNTLFPPGPISLGKAYYHVKWSIYLDSGLLKDAVRDPSLRPNYDAYVTAVTSQQDWIVSIMERDEGFLTCMEHEIPWTIVQGMNRLSYEWLSEFFFAAEVCQIEDGRDLGIHYPRVEDYLPGHEEGARFSQEKVIAKVAANAKAKAKAGGNSSDAFHLLPAHPSTHGGLSRMMFNAGATVHRWERGAKKMPWAKMEANEKAALIRLESHY